MSGAGAIEQALLDAGKISGDALNTAKAQSQGNRSVWKTAVALGYIAETDALKLIGRQFGIPCLNAEEIPDSTFDIAAAGISSGYLGENRIYPVRLSGDLLEVVLCDPAAIPLAEALLMGAGRDLKVSLATEEAVHMAIERTFGKGASVMDSIVGRVDEEGGADEETEDADHLADLASGAPVIKLVNLIIQRAVERGASDIHIEPFETDVAVRYRVDGILHHVESPPKKTHAALLSRLKIMARLNIAEKRLPQDGRIRTRIGGRDIDMRVSTLPTVHGEGVVMRILDRGSVVIDLGALGFPEKELAQFNDIIQKPYGMLLVTGPTGSGKTTTLYAALDKINTPDKKIITVEDPVEYQMKGINQIQVRPQIGLSFQNGLRSIVRQDPDVIMVGEIRDFETAEIAIQAALTGHMVFSTVHTNDSAGAVTRLLDMGVEHYLISSALAGALAQRLVRVLCPACKRPYDAPENIRAMTGGPTAWREQGCKECGNTGYRGRLGIYEMLVVDDAVRNLILQRSSSHIIKEQARRAGMRTLREDGWRKVREGLTSVSEVARVTAEEVL